MIEGFRRPELSDAKLISDYFHKYPTRSCDRTFANVYLWAKFYQVEFTKYKNTLVFRDNSAGYGYAFPVGAEEDVRAVIPDLIRDAKEAGKPFCLYGITREHFEQIEQWFPGQFTCE